MISMFSRFERFVLYEWIEKNELKEKIYDEIWEISSLFIEMCESVVDEIANHWEINKKLTSSM